jgi:hypothetical protein
MKKNAAIIALSLTAGAFSQEKEFLDYIVTQKRDTIYASLRPDSLKLS